MYGCMQEKASSIYHGLTQILIFYTCNSQQWMSLSLSNHAIAGIVPWHLKETSLTMPSSLQVKKVGNWSCRHQRLTNATIDEYTEHDVVFNFFLYNECVPWDPPVHEYNLSWMLFVKMKRQHFKCRNWPSLFPNWVRNGVQHPYHIDSHAIHWQEFNPPTDRPFETIQNFHFQKCPLVLYTHGDTIWTVLVASCTTIQIHSNGFRGSIDSPLRSIQTRFCISCTTIWKDPNKVLY